MGQNFGVCLRLFAEVGNLKSNFLRKGFEDMN